MNPEQVSTVKKRWADSRKIAKHALCKSQEVFAVWGKLRDLGLLKRAREGDPDVIKAITDYTFTGALYWPMTQPVAKPKDPDQPTLADYRAVIKFIKTVGGFKRAASIMPKFAEFYQEVKELT